jgi:hypothetical protein
VLLTVHPLPDDQAARDLIYICALWLTPRHFPHCLLTELWFLCSL